MYIYIYVYIIHYCFLTGKDQKPCKFDTDVNAPALAEHLYNRQGNDSSVAYITVGTGIGVGVIVNNKPVHGLLHPEGGHITVKRRPGDTFPGAKGSLHGDDLEALVAINAIAQRAKCDTKDLKNYKKGVWSLPPRYANGEENKDYFKSIGESDRMTLKFRKNK